MENKQQLKISNVDRYELRDEQTDNGVRYIIEGVACHYGVKNNNNEIDSFGCFDKHIASVKQNGQCIQLVLNHNDDNDESVIGKVVEFKNTATELRIVAELVDTPYIRNEVVPKIKAGLYPAFSTFGWATDWTPDEAQKAFVVHNAVLMSVALVSQGSDPKASYTFEEIKNAFSETKEITKKETIKGIKL